MILKKINIIIILLMIGINLLAKDKIEIFKKEKNKNKILLLANNNDKYIPYFVTVDITNQKNIKTSAKLPYSFVIPPGTKDYEILTIEIKDKNKSYSYSYNYNFIMGNPKAKHNDTYAYLFPYQHGKKHILTQGFHGKSTHYGRNEYALDFEMDIGTPVVAARSGTVVDVRKDSNIGGNSEKYSEYSNYIMIYHKDGSFGNYVHLKQNGVKVKVGDKVKAGDIIGYSGNTGRSSGPHLHFDVSIATYKGELQSIPIKMLYHNGNSIIPKQGEVYYSTHPGKPEYKIILGKNITNKNYIGYKKTVKKTNKLDIRSEQIDNTTILFLNNGYNKKYSVTVKFTLNNLTASKELPIKLEIPGLTECFLVILNPKDKSKSSSYKINYSYKPIN